MTWEKEEKTMKHRIKILLLAGYNSSALQLYADDRDDQNEREEYHSKRCKPDLQRNRIAEQGLYYG